MTRIAAFSDIHGNLRALDAVLSDLYAQGTPDAVWVLGDLAAFMPWPAQTLARLRDLPNVAFVQGNTDRYVATGVRPALSVDSAEDWQSMPKALAVRDANFQWTVDRIDYRDRQFLAGLSTQLEMDVPGYGRVVAVHGAPGDDEARLYPGMSDQALRLHLGGLDARLLLGGHTHLPNDRTVDGIRVINDGSVGLPFDGDNRPSYVLLDFERGACAATLRRVAYDVEQVVTELERVGHPMRQWLRAILRTGWPAQ